MGILWLLTWLTRVFPSSNFLLERIPNILKFCWWVLIHIKVRSVLKSEWKTNKWRLNKVKWTTHVLLMRFWGCLRASFLCSRGSNVGSCVGCLLRFEPTQIRAPDACLLAAQTCFSSEIVACVARRFHCAPPYSGRCLAVVPFLLRVFQISKMLGILHFRSIFFSDCCNLTHTTRINLVSSPKL